MNAEKSKKTYESGALRKALVDAGLKILRESGIQNLGLREVARQVGVSEAAPYRHFKNKDELIAEIASEGFKRLKNYMNEAMLLAGDDLEKQFYACGDAYFRFAIENRDHFQVIFGGMLMPNGPEEFPELHECGMDTFQVLVDMLSRCQKAGLIRSENILGTALGVWSSVHGLASLHSVGKLEIVGMPPEMISKVMHGLMLTVWRGLK